MCVLLRLGVASASCLVGLPTMQLAKTTLLFEYARCRKNNQRRLKNESVPVLFFCASAALEPRRDVGVQKGDCAVFFPPLTTCPGCRHNEPIVMRSSHVIAVVISGLNRREPTGPQREPSRPQRELIILNEVM